MVRAINIKAKKMDYDDFHAGFEGIEKTYALLQKSDGPTDQSRGLIDAAIPEFEKVVQNMDLEDKKARVNAGSCNLDRWNMRFNKDANVEINSNLLFETITKYIISLKSQSHEISLAIWQARPLHAKLKEWFWSNVAIWLERLTQNTRY